MFKDDWRASPRLTLALLVLVLLAAGGNARAAESIGTPCAAPGFNWGTQNVWDMTVYHGFLYAGCGNASNAAPGANAGPIPVWQYPTRGYFDPMWRTRWTVEDEQIGAFVRLADGVAIPGMDAIEGWERGNWYRLGAANRWEKLRTIPNAIHVYDLADFDGLRFAALGNNDGRVLAVSADGGASWSTQVVPVGSRRSFYPDCRDGYYSAPRGYELFALGGRLYLNGQRLYVDCLDFGFRTIQEPALYEWDGNGFVPTMVDLFGSFDGDRIAVPVNFGERLVYVVARTVNDHQWEPTGLAYAGADGQPHALRPARCDAPYDLTVFLDGLYLLCSQRQPDGGWRVSVQLTCDLRHFVEVLGTEDAPLFGRSLAITADAGGMVVYYALGGNTATPVEAQAQVGSVYREELPFYATCRR